MQAMEAAGKSGCSRLLLGFLMMILGAALALQYPLWGALLAGAGLLALGFGMWRMQRVESAMREAASRPFRASEIRQLEDLMLLPPETFLAAMAHMFRARGFEVFLPSEDIRRRDDVQLILRRGEALELAQVIHPPQSLTSEDVRAFAATVRRRGAAKGWIVGGGAFTELAHRAAAQLSVELVDGAALRAYWEAVSGKSLPEPPPTGPLEPYAEADMEKFPFGES